MVPMEPLRNNKKNTLNKQTFENEFLKKPGTRMILRDPEDSIVRVPVLETWTSYPYPAGTARGSGRGTGRGTCMGIYI